MSYDPQCEALARAFIEDNPDLHQSNGERYIELLADDIQSTISDNLEHWREHPVEAEPGAGLIS